MEDIMIYVESLIDPPMSFGHREPAMIVEKREQEGYYLVELVNHDIRGLALLESIWVAPAPQPTPPSSPKA